MSPFALVMLSLGIAALLAGGIIALLASHHAPDGFEDEDGFHLDRPSRGISRD